MNLEDDRQLEMKYPDLVKKIRKVKKSICELLDEYYIRDYTIDTMSHVDAMQLKYNDGDYYILVGIHDNFNNPQEDRRFFKRIGFLEAAGGIDIHISFEPIFDGLNPNSVIII